MKSGRTPANMAAVKANLIADLMSRSLGIIRVFLTPLILLPVEYGQLGLASAFLLYVSFSDLGLLRQFEISSSMRPETLRSELRILLRKLIPRLLVSGSILAVIMGLQFSSWIIALVALVTTLTFNLDMLAQMILRHQSKTKSLAIAVAAQAVVVTALVAPAAYYWRVPGLLALQALTPLVSFAIARSAWSKHRITEHQAAPWADSWGSGMAWWLLWGQAIMTVWITADRLFLSRVLSNEELGLWNLGSMTSAVLLGVANTWGALKMRSWKDQPGSVFSLGFMAFLVFLWVGGSFSLMIFTQVIAPKYQQGLYWNLAWFSANLGLAAVFSLDAFKRARMQSPTEAKYWFYLKAMALLMGGMGGALMYTSLSDARLSVVFALICSVAFMFALNSRFFRSLKRMSP